MSIDKATPSEWDELRKNTHSAFERQVGGNHYKKFKHDPAKICEENGLTFLEGCIVKRIHRWRDKNGVEDLRKARHELDMLLELALNEVDPIEKLKQVALESTAAALGTEVSKLTNTE